MTGAFLAGLVAGYGVAIPVGAIAILILGLSARTSFRVGSAAALGVATADGMYAAVAALGGAAVASGLAPFAGPLRLIAAGVLLALACLTAWRAMRPPAPAQEPNSPAPAQEPSPRGGLDTPVRAFAAVLALTLLNPATVVYFVALVLGRGDVLGSSPVGAAAFTAGVFLASASWQLLIAGGGSLIGRALTGPRGRRVTALLSSVIIAALAVATVLGV
ncbi:threonine/homoserine/homoserine lactone efflux protein [Micromonospora sp. HB375]|uniref:LysE/ArgO family amino acid transporter n=1 Tax=Micromonospora TaxID=1873 RepID=UPI001AE4482D|nr:MULTISPECIES: LysE family transporter [Micromonospora]MBP1784493.1 threonine/homoserine/homoserine lactone efflux protein [Micromonospora sp. HB375]MDH6471595.1 threonine/homoserine/homoserine lactone efflux protein [Micromonospora sp. H404/HB375]WDQ02415.1 LysE family transporter [Micromonospora chalcea]